MSGRYNLEKLKVLCVDDSPYMIQILRTLLQALGVKTVHSIDPRRDVIGEIKVWRPDLIIMDHLMKPIDGLELIRMVRNLKGQAYRFVPIVLLTGNAHQEVVTQARFFSGADAVLVKPVSARRLHECLIALVESDRTFVETETYFGPDRRVKDRPFEGGDRRGGAALAQAEAGPGGPSGDGDEGLELELVPIDPAGVRDRLRQVGGSGGT